MHRTRTSLRFKLITWMIVIWALIQGTLTVVIWLYERESVKAFFDDRLRTVASKVAGEVASIPPPLSSLTLERVASRYSVTGLFDRIVIVAYGPDQEIFAAMERPAAENQRIDPGVFAELKGGAVLATSALGLATMNATEGRVRTVASIMPGEHYPGYLLVIEAEENHSRQLGNHFTEVIMGSILAGLLGVAVGATIISGIISRPMNRLSTTLKGMSPDTVAQVVSSDRESTELAAVRRELEAARKRMEHGFMLQERFISNAAHELTTPIAVLLTDAQTLPAMTDIPPEMRAFVKHVIKELRQLGDTVEGFLLLARVREGKALASATTEYPINELLLDCVESCSPMARMHAVPISVTMLESDDDLDLMIRGVPELLRTMLDNLVRNAVRFTPSGSAVELAVEHPGRREIRFTVRDYGPGIPPDLIESLFARFTQSEPERQMRRGSGLGLAIAQGIAELHHGRISVENCQDRGCRFTIVLPLAPPQDDCPDLDINAAKP